MFIIAFKSGLLKFPFVSRHQDLVDQHFCSWKVSGLFYLP